jgi:hypothetical protein
LYFEIKSCSVAQAGLGLAIFLPQLPKCQDYKHIPPHPAPSVLYSLEGSHYELPTFKEWGVRLHLLEGEISI